MQPISLRTSFLALTFLGITLVTGGLFTACSTIPQSQSQAPNTTATNTSGMHGIGHGSSMDHTIAMDLGPADANFDLRFIDAMTPHHQGAIVMAKETQQKAQHPQIKQLAQNIIRSQSQDIAEMKLWRQQWYPKASNTPMTYNKGQMVSMSPDQMQDMMMNQDLGAADSQFDLRFIKAMIPHHQGAVKMAQDALNKSKHPEIKQLAQEIIKSQQIEIEQMKQWRQGWYQE